MVQQEIVGPFSMRKEGATVILQFENSQYSDIFFRKTIVRPINALSDGWKEYLAVSPTTLSQK